jgi:cytochrome P450
MTVTTSNSVYSACPFHAISEPAKDEVPVFQMLRDHPLHPPAQLNVLRKQRGPSLVRLWDGSTTWVATHYDDVREVLGDPRFSTVTSRPGYPFVSAQRRDILLNGRPNFTFMDPPEHTKFRRMLARMFTVDRFARMRPQIQEIVDRQCDILMAQEKPADFVELFAFEVPVKVLALLVGIPQEGQDLFLQAGKTRFDLGGDPASSHATGEVLWEYLDRLLARTEEAPGDGDDVVTRLVVEQVLPGKLSREEAILVVNQLLVAGFDTTAGTIAMGTLALLENPEQFALLRAEPDRVQTAVHEILRYAAVLQFHASRAATEDVEIGGQLIRAGEGVLALLHAANRDPAEFPDPEVFNIERDAAHHLTFSFGIHQCLGQSLARLELQIAFATLAQKLPNLRLAQPLEDIEFMALGLAYGPRSLLVEW